MQGAVLGLVAVKEQKWVDEDREVGDDGDVESTPFLEHLGVYLEPIAEVDAGGVSGPQWLLLSHVRPVVADPCRRRSR